VGRGVRFGAGKTPPPTGLQACHRRSFFPLSGTQRAKPAPRAPPPLRHAARRSLAPRAPPPLRHAAGKARAACAAPTQARSEAQPRAACHPGSPASTTIRADRATTPQRPHAIGRPEGGRPGGGPASPPGPGMARRALKRRPGKPAGARDGPPGAETAGPLSAETRKSGRAGSGSRCLCSRRGRDRGCCLPGCEGCGALRR
jgi:hypothetical protein